MRFGSMMGDVFRSLFKQPVTRRYPFERKNAPDRLRGKLHWISANCTGCQLCVKDCPAEALEVFMIDKAKKQFVMRYHVDRCTFCSQCVISCRQNALEMASNEWELAATTKEGFDIYYGNEAHIRRLVGSAPADTVPVEQP